LGGSLGEKQQTKQIKSIAIFGQRYLYCIVSLKMEPKTAVTLPLEKTYKKLTYGQNLTESCLGAHMEMVLPTLQPGHTPHPLISSPGRLNMTITMASANGNKNHITQTGCTEMLSRHTLPIPV